MRAPKIRDPKLHAYSRRNPTAPIAVAITGCTRWGRSLPKKFWDLRPFTRVIQSVKQFNAYDAYLDLNDLESEGFPRRAARWLLRMRKLYRGVPL